jgi:SAM-dependent methyltransferase
MSKITKWMDQTFYSDFNNHWDDTKFRELLLKEMKSTHRCLDYGAGRGNVKQMNFLGDVEFIAGVDPEKDVLKNPYLNEAKVITLGNNVIPYEDNSFDLVFSDNVLEHVQNPEIVFQEISRVLKSGGTFMAKTPNKWHYMPLIARITPHWFHNYYNKLRGRKTIDTFPTVYKCNSKPAVIKYAKKSGLKVSNFLFIEGRPEYLRLNALTYFIGLIYERMVNFSEIFSPLRIVMIFKIEKP